MGGYIIVAGCSLSWNLPFVNMRIIYDNIVYNLQKSGGVSVYWAELSKRLNVSKKLFL